MLWLSADLRAATHEFLAEARAGQYERAHELASAHLRATVPPTAFPAYVDAAAPSLAGSTGEWINGFSGSGSRQCIEAWLTGPNVLVDPVYLILVDEGGTWRVDAVTGDEPSLCNTD